MRSRFARLSPLQRDQRGATALEFGLAVPVFTVFIWGMFQVSMLYSANAGMQNALGEGARYATVYVPSTQGPPSDSAILGKISAYKFGTGNGSWGTPSIATDNTAKTKTITVTYSQPTDFIFFQGPTVSITKSKTVYISML